jgi:L-lactate utilization protein LutB
MTLKSPKVLHRELAARCNEMLKRTEWRNYLRDALTRTLRMRRETISLLFTDFEMFRDDVREVKERAVNRLDEMFEMFKKTARKGVSGSILRKTLRRPAVSYTGLLWRRMRNS